MQRKLAPLPVCDKSTRYEAHISAMCPLAARRRDGRQYWSSNICGTLEEPHGFGLRTDEQIAADVRSMLTLDLEVPDTRITVSVLDGVVTLGGDVDYYFQRDAAEDDAASIAGVRDVIDTIAVLEQPSALDIADQIAAAFARNGELFDDNVSVTTNGHSVSLNGTVRYWSEYDAAEDVAWRAPGVTNVTNNVVVTY